MITTTTPSLISMARLARFGSCGPFAFIGASLLACASVQLAAHCDQQEADDGEPQHADPHRAAPGGLRGDDAAEKYGGDRKQDERGAQIGASLRGLRVVGLGHGRRGSSAAWCAQLTTGGVSNV